MRTINKTIYAIKNEVNQKIYVGRSENPLARFQRHLSDLRCGKHSVEDMQRDFDLYGENAFTLYILEENVDFSHRINEYKWMKKFHSYARGFGYNYKDPHIAKVKFEKPISAYTENDTMASLHNLIDELDENQRIYAFVLLSKLFATSGQAKNS